MSYYKDPDFLNLRKLWREKLEESGFVDAEDSKERLKSQKLQDFQKRIGFKPDLIETIRDYYIWAEHAMQWAVFESRTDEMIWMLHSQGKSTHEIAEHVCFHQTHVAKRIKKLRAYLKGKEPYDPD